MKLSNSLTFPDNTVQSTAATGGAAPYGTATIDLGSTYNNTFVVTVTDAAINSAHFIQVYLRLEATTDNTVSDHQHAATSWKTSCIAATGSFDIYIDCLTVMCNGTFKIRYTYS